MKKMFFLILFFVVIGFGFESKAQYYRYYPYSYQYSQNNVIVQRQDLGIFGYGNLQNEILRFGRLVGPNLYQQRTFSQMYILGRRMTVQKIRNLQLNLHGSYVWTDLYLNGIFVGRTNVVGRIATTTLYVNSAQRAMYYRVW